MATRWAAPPAHEQQLEHDGWLRKTVESAIEPERPCVDAHHHLWVNHPSRTFVSRYMVEELAQDVGAGHNITHTVYMQSSSAGWVRGDGPAELRPVGESEFVQGVAVQGESGHFGACRLGAGIVGTVDLSLGAEIVEPVLQAHRQAARNFRGIRFLGGKAENINFSDPKVLSSLRMLERMGLTFDCNGPETHPLDFDGVLGGLADAAAACPSLKVVVNHCGGAVGPTAFVDHKKREEWEDCMARLATLPNVNVKVGGLQMQANGFQLGPDARQNGPATSDELLELTHELYGHVIRLFGPHRCMFESNFPVDKWGIPYVTLWNMFKKLATSLGLSEEEKDAIFRGTATTVYTLY